MIQRENPVPTHGGPVEAALAEYFTRVDRGESVDLTQLIAAYPGCEAGLRRFLNKERKLKLAVVETPPAATPSEHLAGHTLGDYRILRELGRGGMGVVYEAEQLSLGRRVALKVLPSAVLVGKQPLARFKNEARAAATLDHPNIVAIHSVGSEGGVHYYAMQLIDGPSLAQVIATMRRGQIPSLPPAEKSSRDAVLSTDDAQLTTDFNQSAIGDSQSKVSSPPSAFPHPPPPLDTLPRALGSPLPAFGSREFYREVARLGIQASNALDQAHQNGILHRDIKPGNLLLDSGGKLYVTDFGLARIEADAGMTMTGDIIGTLRYMAPEQALAKRVVVDHRADIYSLGATLYELLTLQPAFDETDRSVLLKQIAFDEPRALRQVNCHIPVELETIVLKAMRKSAEQRYATAQELADDLQSFLEHKPIKAKPPTWREQAVKWSRRHPAAISAAALFLLATTAISVVSAVLIGSAYQREAAQRKIAEAQRERSDENFKRSIAISEAVLNASIGLGEWSSLPSNWRDKLGEQARKYYELLLQEANSDPALQYETAIGYRSLAEMHYRRSEYEKAEPLLHQSVAILKRLCREHPETLRYHQDLAAVGSRLGTTLLRLGKHDEAKSRLETTFVLFRDVVLKRNDAYIVPAIGCIKDLAQELRWRGESSSAQFEELIATCRKIVASHTHSGMARILLASLLAEQGRLDEAIAEVRELVRLVPHDFRGHDNLGVLLLRKGLLDEAIECCREAIRLAPEESHAHESLGAVLFEKGLFDEAIAEFREAIRLDPKNAVTRGNLGSALRKKYLLDEAVAELRESIRINGNDSHPHYNLGLALEETGLPDQAIAEFRAAIRLNPKGSSDSHAQLGNILHDQGFVDDATREYQVAITLDREAIRRNPDDVRCLLQLAVKLVMCGNHELRDPEEARRLAKRATELAPGKLSAWSVLGVVQYRAADYRGAIESIIKGCELANSEDGWDYFLLAMSEWQLGNRDAAHEWYAKALEWLKAHPQIVGGNTYRFRTEAEELLGIAKGDESEAASASEQHSSNKPLSAAQ